MDDFASIALGLAVSFLIAVGVLFLVMDFRHFDSIERRCAKVGFIQNDTTRILCSVEPKPKAANAQ